MKNYTIHFKSGSTVRVRGDENVVALAANVENGVTILRSRVNTAVIVNPAEVEYITQDRGDV